MNRALVALLTVTVAFLSGKAAVAQSPSSFFAPNRWAVVIGASDYPELGRLEMAAKDAESFAKTLTEAYKFEPDKVTVLTDERESADEKPTVAQINKALDKILNDPRLGQGDLLVFYFSGHGLGGSNGTDLLLPTDSTYENYEQTGLPVKSIMDRIVKSGVDNVVFIADACRSGQRNPFGIELTRLGREANVAVILGCEPGGRSYELPRFGQGAMTYALTQAMRDENLRDPLTGALWISTVAERTKKQVEELTARDQGEQDKQVPSVYCQKNQDILMGGFVGRGGSSLEKLAGFLKDQKEELDEDVYVRYLFSFAVTAAEAGDYEQTVNALRTIRQLDLAWSSSLALEATSLGNLGRETESTQVYDLMVKEFPEEYHSLLYRALNTNDHAERHKYAKAFYEKFHTVDSAMAYMGSYRADPQKTVADVAALCKEFAEYYGESGPGFFFSNYHLGLTGDDPRGMIEDAEMIEIEGVRPEYVEYLFYEVALRTGDPELILETINMISQNPVTTATWELFERPWAEKYVEANPEARLELAGLMLEHARSPERVWTAALLYGVAAGDHVDGFTKAVERFPFAIRAKMALEFARLMKEQPDTFRVSEELMLAGLDDPQFRSEFYTAVLKNVILFESFLFPVEGWAGAIVSDLVKMRAIGHSAWWNALTFGTILMGREDIIDPMLPEATTKAPGTVWLEFSVLSALNRLHPEEAEKALKAFGKTDDLLVGSLWSSLELYWLMREDKAKADAVSKLKDEYVPGSADSFAVGVWRAVLAGDKALLERMLKVEQDQWEQFYAVEAAKAKMGMRPVDESFEIMGQGVNGVPWVHAELMRILAPKLSEEQKHGLLTYFLPFRPERAYDRVVVPGHAVPATGELDLTLRLSMQNGPGEAGTGKLKWSAGKATFEMVVGTKKATLTGSINESGGLVLTGQIDGKKFTVNGRIVSPDLWKSEEYLDCRMTLLSEDAVWGELYLALAKSVAGLGPTEPVRIAS